MALKWLKKNLKGGTLAVAERASDMALWCGYLNPSLHEGLRRLDRMRRRKRKLS